MKEKWSVRDTLYTIAISAWIIFALGPIAILISSHGWSVLWP